VNKADNELMTEYGITRKTKTVYSYKQHNYERFKDALSYAEIDINRHQRTSSLLLGTGEINSGKYH